MMNQTVAFIGTGAMGGAIARGLVSSGVCSPDRLILSDIRREWVESLASELGARVAESNLAAVKEADILLLAVKPQVLPEVARELGPSMTPRQLVISILAGVEISTLESLLGEDVSVVRVMPNILATVQSAYSVYSTGRNVKPEHEEAVQAILGAVGGVESADEKLMDAVTGLSGSGPGFVFVMIEALADGGVHAGLSRALALKLAAHTVLGSAKMWLETGKHPGELKDMVTSPGGTTIAGIAAMEAAGVRSGLIRAVTTAAKRSKELSGK